MTEKPSPLPPLSLSPETQVVSSARLWSPAAAGVQIHRLLRQIRASLSRIWVGAASLHLGTLGLPSPSPVAPVRRSPLHRRLGAMALVPARRRLPAAGAPRAPGAPGAPLDVLWPVPVLGYRPLPVWPQHGSSWWPPFHGWSTSSMAATCWSTDVHCGSISPHPERNILCLCFMPSSSSLTTLLCCGRFQIQRMLCRRYSASSGCHVNLKLRLIKFTSIHLYA